MLGGCVTGNFGLAPGIPVGENLGCLEHDYPLERILAAVHLNVQVGQSSGAGGLFGPVRNVHGGHVVHDVTRCISGSLLRHTVPCPRDSP